MCRLKHVVLGYTKCLTKIILKMKPLFLQLLGKSLVVLLSYQRYCYNKLGHFVHAYHSIQGTSTTHRDSIFFQATLPKSVWELAVEIMNLFEQGRLKNQKLNMSSLVSKPQFKQQYLSPIRALPLSDQMAILQKVIDKECSIFDIKKIASDLKNMTSLKAAFVKLTNSESWQKSQEMYPAFATEDQLSRFIGCNLKQGIPKFFQDFCYRAKVNTECTETQESSINFTSKSGIPITVDVLCCKYNELNGQLIRNSQPSFNGIDLALIHIDNEVITMVHA